jgi:hypothetical protein
MLLSRHALHERRRRHDRDIPEWIKSEQIAVAAHDQIRAAVPCPALVSKTLISLSDIAPPPLEYRLFNSFDEITARS